VAAAGNSAGAPSAASAGTSQDPGAPGRSESRVRLRVRSGKVLHVSWSGNSMPWKVMDLEDTTLYFLGVKLRAKATDALESAKETLEDVQEASRRVVATTEWATVALVVVSAVSLVALGIATAAYIRAGQGVDE
jgi:hypothetical protein